MEESETIFVQSGSNFVAVREMMWIWMDGWIGWLGKNLLI